MQLIIVINKIIPFPGFPACTILFWLFCRHQPSETTITHENIHFRQELEMIFIFFYLWYAIEYVVRLLQYLDFHQAYRNISLEREAYTQQNSPTYLSTRPLYSWIHYLS